MHTIREIRFIAVCSLFSLAPTAGHAESVIDEIVVTADFRERTASELPASITVLDAEQIDEQALQHFEELINAIPNLNWSGDGHRARYFQIRGVGELEQYQGAPNPSVGFLVDDIDFSGIGTIATLFDIDQVEVLRGPQGTRYGANALAGLIYMRSAAPTEEFEGRAELTVGDDDAFAGGIAFGGGLSGSAAYRFSAHHHRSNGFRDNSFLGRDDTNGREETTVRGRLHWAASDDWNLEFATVFANIDDGYDAFALDNSYTMLSDKPGKDAQQSTGASVRAEYSGWLSATLTSITSFADSDIEFSFDADWGNDDSWAPVTYDYVSLNDRQRTTLSQEFRLASDDWLLGLYTMRLEEKLGTVNLGEYHDPFYDWADSLDDRLTSRYEAQNVAVFGQYDFEISRVTRMSAGMRLERRTTDYRDSTGLEQGPSESMSGGELTLSHDHSGTVTSFVSVSKGYKAGGFNLGFVPDDRREFGAEAMWNLEIGIKSSLADGALQINAALFHARRDRQQVRTSLQLIPGDPASFVFFTDNVAKGRTNGLEADLRWWPSDTWSLYAGLGLLDADFESGRAQAHAPRYTLAIGGSYDHPGGFFAGLDIAAKDEFYFDVSHDQKSQPYELVNARVGLERDEWSVRLWARNLLDKEYAVRGFYFGNEPPDFPDTLYTRLGDPRQVGVTFDKRF
jgi:outer membrane receptor protein involved in Fe transport